ncbi:MAG: tetratricopeptide repeat protein, partial [Bryobacteraceae bacterium]
ARPGQAASPPAGQQETKQPRPKSQAEVAALQKVQAAYGAQNWDAAIQAIDNVLESFPDTDYKNLLLDMAANAAESKGDYAATITYGERALAANPQDSSVLVQLAEEIAQHTHDTDLDKDQSVKKVKDYADKALALLKNPASPPPPGVPAAQWPQLRTQLTGRAYDALGVAAGLEKNYSQQIDYLKTSLSSDQNNPVTMARLSKAYLDNKQYDEAISEANQVLALNQAPAQVKQFAQAQKAAATQAKGAKPAAPPPAKAKGAAPASPAPAK